MYQNSPAIPLTLKGTKNKIDIIDEVEKSDQLKDTKQVYLLYLCSFFRSYVLLYPFLILVIFSVVKKRGSGSATATSTQKNARKDNEVVVLDSE